MEYFDMESRGVPWKILRVYFAMETPWVWKRDRYSAALPWFVLRDTGGGHLCLWLHDNETQTDDVADAGLSGSDVFLDATVHCYLSELLRLYCKPTYLDRMDFSQPVPGLASFHDLYEFTLHQSDHVCVVVLVSKS